MDSCRSLFLVLSSLLTICASTNGAADLQLVMASSRLPVAVDNARAVYDGEDSIYIVGGQGTGGLQESIVKYSLSSDIVEVLGPFIGKASGAAVFFAGDVFYLDGSGSDFQIHRFSTTSRNSTLVAQLPFTFYLKAHAWDADSERLFLFGGLNGSWSVDSILVYSPADNRVEEVDQLPEVLSTPAAVLDRGGSGAAAYVFDGWSTNVLRYRPAEGDVTTLPGQLPLRMVWPCAAIGADRRAYMFGGDAWMRFDTVTGQAEDIDVEGWGGADINASACLYISKLDRIYVIGGKGHYNGTTHDYRHEISYIDLGAPKASVYKSV